MQIDRIPAPARAKISALTTRAADGRLLVQSARERVDEAEKRLAVLVHNLAEIREPKQIAAASREIAALEAEIETLRRAQTERMQRAGSDAQTMAQIRDFLAKLPPHAALKSMSPRPAKLEAGENVAEGVARVRKEIAGLKAKCKAIAFAPVPLEDLRAEAAGYVEALGKRYRPKVGLQNQLVIDWRRERQNIPGMTPDETAGLLAWLFPAQMTKALEQEIAATLAPQSASVTPIGRHERQRHIRILDAKILHHERIEEALVEQAIAAGAPVFRRIDANPLAILGLDYEAKKAAQAA